MLRISSSIRQFRRGYTSAMRFAEKQCIIGQRREKINPTVDWRRKQPAPCFIHSTGNNSPHARKTTFDDVIITQINYIQCCVLVLSLDTQWRRESHARRHCERFTWPIFVLVPATMVCACNHSEANKSLKSSHLSHTDRTKAIGAPSAVYMATERPTDNNKQYISLHRSSILSFPHSSHRLSFWHARNAGRFWEEELIKSEEKKMNITVAL